MRGCVCLWVRAYVPAVYMGNRGVSPEGVCLWECACVPEVHVGNMGVSHEGVCGVEEESADICVWCECVCLWGV